MHFPLLQICFTSVLWERMTWHPPGLSVYEVTGKAEVWSRFCYCYYLLLFFLIKFLIDVDQIYSGSDQHHTRLSVDLQKWEFVFSTLAHPFCHSLKQPDTLFHMLIAQMAKKSTIFYYKECFPQFSVFLQNNKFALSSSTPIYLNG